MDKYFEYLFQVPLLEKRLRALPLINLGKINNDNVLSWNFIYYYE